MAKLCKIFYGKGFRPTLRVDVEFLEAVLDRGGVQERHGGWATTSLILLGGSEKFSVSIGGGVSLSSERGVLDWRSWSMVGSASEATM